ncbi:MAG: CHAT domain-containing tetratricopeptide repeat protein [Saprospiraceae bacterium]
MKVYLSILGLLAFISLPAQQNTALLLAKSMSENEQYQASNEVLTDFIINNPQRLYDLSNVYFLRSYNFMQLGAYVQAMAANRESMALKERLVIEGIGENYMRSGAIYLLAGDYDQALEHLLMAKDYPIESGEVYALIDGYLGATYMELNQLKTAEKYFLQSIESLEIEFGDKHPALANSYYNIGQLASLQGDAVQAESYLKKALNIAVELRQHKTLAKIYNALAKVYEVIDIEKVYLTYEKAISLLQRQYGQYNVALARTYLHLSQFYWAEKDLVKAKEYLGNALASLLPKANVRNWTFLPDAAEVPLDPILLVQVLVQRTRMLAQNDQEAELFLAFESTRLASELLAEQLVIVGGGARRLLLTEKLYDIFEPGIQAGLALAKAKGEESYAIAAFDLAEKSKAMIAAALAKTSDLQATALSKGIAFRETLMAAQKNLEEQGQNTEVMNQLKEAQQLWQSYQAQLPASSNLGISTVFELPKIQDQLKPAELLVSYFLGKDQYYIFAVAKDGFKALSIPDAPTPEQQNTSSTKGLSDQVIAFQSKGSNDGLKMMPLLTLIKAYRRAINEKKDTDFIQYTTELYDRLIAPISDQLTNKKHLIILPHHELFTIPFEAFLTAPVKSKQIKYHRLPYLIKDYTIRYANEMAYAFAKGDQPAPYTYDFVGFAPGFAPLEENNYTLDNHYFLSDTSNFANEVFRSITTDKWQFKPLPFSAQEIVDVAALLTKDGKTSKVFLQQEATIENFKSEALKARYIHLATHSFSESGKPSISGVAFAPPPSEDHSWKESILYLPAIQNLPLSTELVVLSSAEGNMGATLKGEGVASLVRAFAQTGSPRTLSALWPGYETQTHALMQHFYAHLLKGNSYEAALQSAKLQMLKDKKIAPWMWSGFLLWGQP